MNEVSFFGGEAMTALSFRMYLSSNEVHDIAIARRNQCILDMIDGNLPL
jgi:hypothetical protein